MTLQRTKDRYRLPPRNLHLKDDEYVVIVIGDWIGYLYRNTKGIYAIGYDDFAFDHSLRFGSRTEAEKIYDDAQMHHLLNSRVVSLEELSVIYIMMT